MSEIPAEVDSLPWKRMGSALLSWYRRHRRRLPWREDPQPYKVWLSEIMLQQTRVETVVPYFERFLERFPTLADLAGADENAVLAAWSGLGYYRRARNLHAGARQVLVEHDGDFPRQLEAALDLPGVGPYTAAAILSIAYNLPHPVVDGNVERVVTRLVRLADNPRTARTARVLRETVRGWMPRTTARDFNQALMELGATVCTPTSPRCDECPLRRSCLAVRHGDPTRFPRLPARRAPVRVELDVGILERRGRYLLERVEGLSYLEGLWLFPIAERTATASLAEGLAAKLGTEIDVVGDMPPLRHSITYRRLTLRPRLLDMPAGTTPRRRRGLRWARLDELGEKIPVSSICLKLAAKLRAPGDP